MQNFANVLLNKVYLLGSFEKKERFEIFHHENSKYIYQFSLSIEDNWMFWDSYFHDYYRMLTGWNILIWIWKPIKIANFEFDFFPIF